MGSGDNGRIVKRDVFNLDSSNEVRVEQTNRTPTNNLKEGFTEIPISQMRRTIATRLSQSKFTSPHFYLNIEVEMDNLIKLRKEINEKNEVKISFNDIIVKATSMAIQKHPHINSSWHDSHIKLHSNINIGVAVSVDNGLIVPVIKNSNFKSFTEISTITSDFVKKAKENKLQPSDWEGNTFTISNLGMFGIDDFTAIINPPDACILAVGAIKERPISKDGVIVSGNVMRLTLSSDHRIVDGVLGSKFLRTLKDMLEQPMMMFC
jgi:pyruvate dehydrogenase E2 component (dihydrolipoamide acetyltransferase)